MKGEKITDIPRLNELIFSELYQKTMIILEAKEVVHRVEGFTYDVDTRKVEEVLIGIILGDKASSYTQMGIDPALYVWGTQKAVENWRNQGQTVRTYLPPYEPTSPEVSRRIFHHRVRQDEDGSDGDDMWSENEVVEEEETYLSEEDDEGTTSSATAATEDSEYLF